MEHLIRNGHPPIDTYLNWREINGWSLLNRKSVQASFDQSLYALVAYEYDEPVAMGRLVGDGHIYLYVQDLLVHPTSQNLGFGSTIMRMLLKWAEEHADPNAFIGLMAADGSEGFYRKHGFVKRPEGCPGMMYNLPK